MKLHWRRSSWCSSWGWKCYLQNKELNLQAHQMEAICANIQAWPSRIPEVYPQFGSVNNWMGDHLGSIHVSFFQFGRNIMQISKIVLITESFQYSDTRGKNMSFGLFEPKTNLDDLISYHATWSCLLSVGNALSTAYLFILLLVHCVWCVMCTCLHVLITYT